MRFAFNYKGNFTVDVKNFAFWLRKFAHPEDSLCRLFSLLEIAKVSTFLLFVFLLRILQFPLRYCLEGKEGSSLEHLSSLDFQIKKDEERLSAIQRKVRVSEETYSVSTTLDTTNVRIEEIGRKNPITKSVTVTKEEYDELTTLAKEGISNRIKIQSLREDLRDSYRRNSSLAERLNTLEENYELLWRKCRPYLDAVRQFPALVSEFIERVRLSLEDRIKASVEREER